MSAQLRPVARIERDLGHILHVEGMKVGVRMMYSYLLRPLQLYIYDEPNGEFASNLRLAGQISRDPDKGPGFIRLYYNRIEIPLTDWAARERGERAPTEVRTVPFRTATTAKLVEICGQAHQDQVKHLIYGLTVALRAAWFSDASALEVCELATGTLMEVPEMDGVSVDHFQSWVSSMLQHTTLRDAHSFEI